MPARRLRYDFHVASAGDTARPLRFDVIDDDMARVLREKTGAERLKIADGMFRFARELIKSSVTSRHPEWNEAMVAAEVARRLSHGAV